MTIADWKGKFAQDLRIFAGDLRVSMRFAGSMGLEKCNREDEILAHIRKTLVNRNSDALVWISTQCIEPLQALRKEPMLPAPADPVDLPRVGDRIEARKRQIIAPLIPIIEKLEAFADVFPEGKIPPYPKGEWHGTFETSWTDPLEMPALLKLAGLNGPDASQKPLGRMLANLRAAGERGATVHELTSKGEGGAHTRGKKSLQKLSQMGLAELLAVGDRWRLAQKGRVNK